MAFEVGDIVVCSSISQAQFGIEREIVDIIYDQVDPNKVIGYVWTYPDLHLADTMDNTWDSRNSSDPTFFWWKLKTKKHN